MYVLMKLECFIKERKINLIVSYGFFHHIYSKIEKSKE